ncbi:HD-GYP domain-containing protein [Aquipseudomonas ullengensis]|uniref:GAF domain-containing protein n=1 Tax=Aquipseudomonas ullengensis TaxID=2759166 RepID=A0A7W4LKN4_9GAMM|nr:HD domain-containing phosphohydrolase [Pseudomonas ullengensis]MBB2494919.1 GAF domain-containing protein [Pseudomonas ullengensis]
MPRSIRLRPLIVLTCVFLVICTGVTIALLAYERGTRVIYRNALMAAERAGDVTRREFSSNLVPIRSAVRLFARNSNLRSAGLVEQLRMLPLMAEALHALPAARAFFFADQQGNLFYLRRPLQSLDPQVPEDTAYVALSINPQAGQATRLYFNAALEELARRDDPQSAQLAAPQRPWFQQALASRGIIRTAPYHFFNSDEIGSTIALATEDKQWVVGADLSHHRLDQMLQQNRMTASTRLILSNLTGQVLATDDPSVFHPDRREPPRLAELPEPALKALVDLPQVATVGLLKRQVGSRTWHVQRLLLQLEESEPLLLDILVPEDELFAAARTIRNGMFTDTLFILLLAVPLAIWLSGLLVASFGTLTRKAQALSNFDFEAGKTPLRSKITEVRELDSAMSDSGETLQRFITTLGRLSAETNLEHLLPTLLRSTCEASGARGGLLYIQQGDALQLMAGLWQEQALELDEAAGTVLFGAQQALAEQRLLAQPADGEACARLNLPPTATLNVPLFNRRQQRVGALVLFNEAPLQSHQLHFVEALSGFAAVALETHGLIELQRQLFEAFIELIASAIDAKSPYTGGHCSRVPEVAKLLAEAACAETQGPYADFSMSSDDWRALHIGSWLHDCGKVTTPEYVVDKATKLETLYDRIHEVRTRFEVLKRDAQISYLQALQDGAEVESARAARDALLTTLDEEFAFVAACNTGSEFMGEEQLQRLHAIAERTWLRTLDDRLGISGEERLRKEAQPVEPLPVLEQLLADRPEQRIERRDSERYAADNPWGFNMPIPELLYDRGELKNLSIRRGTLTEEERFKINEHIVQTIRMLNALPFPAELAQIPEIAGGHHERMDGKGYPCGLTGDQLSPQARMMSIADVFEALTARDRPYKPSKTLAQALRIMRNMSEEGHLDPELFSIFLRSGACLRYAEQYLDADQCDTRELLEFLPASAS